MSHVYQGMIIEDTGCPASDAEMVEDIMRDDIFHSTLDWQTRTEFRQGARQAYVVLQNNRADYEAFHCGARALFEKMKKQEAQESA